MGHLEYVGGLAQQYSLARFRLQGLRFRVQGLGFRVSGLGVVSVLGDRYRRDEAIALQGE